MGGGKFLLEELKIKIREEDGERGKRKRIIGEVFEGLEVSFLGGLLMQANPEV